MLKTQLSPNGGGGAQQLANLHTAMPITRAIMNPRYPLVLVQYANGRVSVLRIPDGSVVCKFAVSSKDTLISWSTDCLTVYIVENGELCEYRIDCIDPGKPNKKAFGAKCSAFAVTDHLMAYKTSINCVGFSTLNPQFTINTDELQLSGNIVDIVAGKDCVYVLSKDEEDGLMAKKYNILITGHIEKHQTLQTIYAQKKEEKLQIQKGCEQLCDTLQKWRNKAFIDFISVQQLTHFFVKYDAKDVKRDASELQRLEVLFKDALESISHLLYDQDEDEMQKWSRSLSRMTVLLRGADDLELMSVRLKDVIEDIKRLSSDFDFIVRVILSKCELGLSEAKHNLDSRNIQLAISPAFECRYIGVTYEDYCCIDGDLIVVTAAGDTQRIIYKNNEECQRIELDGDIEKVHIASPLSFMVISSTKATVFTAYGSSVQLDCKPITVSGRHGIISCLQSPYNLHIVDLSNIHQKIQ